MIKDELFDKSCILVHAYTQKHYKYIHFNVLGRVNVLIYLHNVNVEAIVRS